MLVNLTVQYSGDRGCLQYTNTWNRVVTQAYTLQCPTREFERGVDRLGMDYERVPMRRPSPRVCREACLNDQPRCRAWTFVAATRGGRDARCYLKSGVPDPRPCSECTSGVISDL